MKLLSLDLIISEAVQRLSKERVALVNKNDHGSASLTRTVKSSDLTYENINKFRLTIYEASNELSYLYLRRTKKASFNLQAYT